MLNFKKKKKRRSVFFQRNEFVYICLLQAIRQLQFNAVKKSLLGSVSEDGAVNLWDINTRRLLHGYSDAHIASATGLKFSPLNDILLLSVGLDKRIICFDVQSKKQDFSQVSCIIYCQDCLRDNYILNFLILTFLANNFMI